ncbi:MAG: hypothetical protein ACI9UO_001894 [Nitrospinales bacterium]|jgi:hypothetical protein
MTTDDKKTTQEEVDIALEFPSVFVNRFTVLVGPVVRITFLEQYGPETQAHPRAAIVLETASAIKLYKLLQELLEKPKGDDTKAKEEHKDG